MSWTEPIDDAKLDHLRRLRSLFASFVLFRTKRLIDLSEWTPTSVRLGLTASLFGIASALMIFASSRFYAYGQGSTGFLIWSATAMIVFALLLIVPAFVGYRLLRIRRSSFILNVILIQQSLLALAALGSSLVLTAQEPARTDFALLRAGLGHGTVAYRRFCGDLESGAEVLALTERGQRRTRTVQRDTREIISWGEPNVSDAPRRMPVVLAQMERRRAELQEATQDLRRMEEITAERAAAVDRFYEAYPTYFLAIDFFVAWFILILLMSSWHLCRAAVLGDRGKRMLPVTIAIVIVTWCFALLFGWSIADGSEYVGYSDVQVSRPHEIGTWAAGLEEFKALEAELHEVSAQIAEERLALRADFLSMRSVCPTANSHGLF